MIAIIITRGLKFYVPPSKSAVAARIKQGISLPPRKWKSTPPKGGPTESKNSSMKGVGSKLMSLCSGKICSGM